MTTDVMAFPVVGGMEGMNKLAIFLNGEFPDGAWHFAAGSRFDQSSVVIDFDDPAALAPTWRRYCDLSKS